MKCHGYLCCLPKHRSSTVYALCRHVVFLYYDVLLAVRIFNEIVFKKLNRDLLEHVVAKFVMLLSTSIQQCADSMSFYRNKALDYSLHLVDFRY